MTFLEKWIEYDYNPFIIFDSQGKVISLNSEAQYLLAKVQNKEMFDLAMNYATETYGFKTFFLELTYDKFEFFAITVGYESENEIGIKLYKKQNKKIKSLDKKRSTLSNIYLLIDLAISTFSTRNDAQFLKNFDPAIPEFYVDVDNILKLFNKTYQLFLGSLKIETKIYINIGEYIKTAEKKYSILRVDIKGDKLDSSKKSDLEQLASNAEVTLYIQKREIFIDIPIIS